MFTGFLPVLTLSNTFIRNAKDVAKCTLRNRRERAKIQQYLMYLENYKSEVTKGN